MGTQLYDDDGDAYGTNDNGVIIYRTDQSWNGSSWSNFLVNHNLMISNTTWDALPATHKLIVYQNGVIHSIVNMNSLSNC